MSFGNRRATPVERRPSRMPVETASEPQEVYREPRNGGGGGAGGTIAMIAATFVAVVGLGFAASFFMSDDAVSSSAPAAVSGATHAQISDVCNRPGSQKVLDQIQEMQIGMKGSIRSPEYLSCMMAQEPARLCNASVRQPFMDELSKYLQFTRALQRQYDAIMQNPQARAMMEVTVQMQAITSGGESPAEMPERPEASALVVEGMHELIKSGYLKSGDFGWPTPAYVEPYIKVKAEKRGC